jgi:hypothetical protein
MSATIFAMLVFMGFAHGEPVGREKADLEAGTVLAQASWVGLSPAQLGELPRRGDIAARTAPLEILTKFAPLQGDSAAPSTSCA